MDLEKLQIIRNETLSIPLEEKNKSEEFAFVFLHSNSPFTLKDYQPPIHAARVYSEYFYPIYFFISPEAINDEFNKLLELYKDIQVIVMPKLSSIYEFNNFSINCLLYHIEDKHNRLIYSQYDGWIIKKGFEEITYGYSWLGAKWKNPIRVIDTKFNFPAFQVGNGGSNFRLRDKCLKALKFINDNGGQEKLVKGLEIQEEKYRYNNSWFLAEDSFFCWAGFGSGIFEPVSLDYADKFALEPITLEQYNNKESYLFHRIDE